ncbi:hypothetical protein BJ875DRAFT_470342 [Amylocarpus encephaloides]|uniref:Uncharacterized protein n=1 Tax=Amylocarpus encephaloides TaxID=45428 RepID=A0A9P7YCJ3_9HELO|nr:hypothetical protein BJ875DRAFT_470342 [Amylocarpus encephaloides]
MNFLAFAALAVAAPLIARHGDDELPASTYSMPSHPIESHSTPTLTVIHTMHHTMADIHSYTNENSPGASTLNTHSTKTFPGLPKTTGIPSMLARDLPSSDSSSTATEKPSVREWFSDSKNITTFWIIFCAIVSVVFCAFLAHYAYGRKNKREEAADHRRGQGKNGTWWGSSRKR